MVTFALMAVLNTALAADGLAPSAPLLEHATIMPRTVEWGQPLTCVVELIASEAFASTASQDAPNAPFDGEVIPGPDPGFTLYKADTGHMVPKASRMPEYLVAPGAVLGGEFDHPVKFRGQGTIRISYLLQRVYGTLSPGEYELSLRLRIRLAQHATVNLPGRQVGDVAYMYLANRKGITRRIMVDWELPELRQKFTIVESSPKDMEKTLHRVQHLITEGKTRNIPYNDWMALLSIGQGEAAHMVYTHLHETCAPVWDSAAVLLLNEDQVEVAIERAALLLESPAWQCYTIGMEVIEQRGGTRSAPLLHECLQSDKDSLMRRTAYHVLSRMLGKPIDPTIGRRPFTEEDAQTALGWLDELEVELREAGPTTRPQMQKIELAVPTQPATQPADVPSQTDRVHDDNMRQ